MVRWLRFHGYGSIDMSFCMTLCLWLQPIMFPNVHEPLSIAVIGYLYGHHRELIISLITAWSTHITRANELGWKRVVIGLLGKTASWGNDLTKWMKPELIIVDVILTSEKFIIKQVYLKRFSEKAFTITIGHCTLKNVNNGALSATRWQYQSQV